MNIYLKLFKNHTQYEEYISSETAVIPNVSHCIDEVEVHYKPYVPPPFFCKLTLNNGEVVDLEGSGALTSAMISSYKSTLVSAEIGTLCTSIGGGAFYQCSGLTSITIGNGVTTIGSGAFYNCSSLTSIDIPDNVTSIGNEAFSYCTSLTSCTIGSGVTSIGNRVFYWCGGLTSIDIPNGVTSIGDNAFYQCSGLTNITIPDNVTSIGNEAFYNTPWWRSYSADTDNQYGNIIYINDVVYKAVNTGIASCEFREGTVSISNWAFTNCSGLTSIDIPDSVTSIGNGALGSCISLTSVTIGNSVTSIGNNVFVNCSSLTSIRCNATTAPSISNQTFLDVKTNGTLTVPSGSNGYDVWMGTGDFYLGKYNWTKVEQ